MEVGTELTKLYPVKADLNASQLLCNGNEVIKIAVSQATGDVDTNEICTKFLDMAAKVFSFDTRSFCFVRTNPCLAISSTNYSHLVRIAFKKNNNQILDGALNTMDLMLTKGAHFRVTDVIDYLKSNPVFPKQFRSILINRIDSEFKVGIYKKNCNHILGL